MENESAIEEIENARVRHADHLSLFFMLLQLSPKQKFFFFFGCLFQSLFLRNAHLF